MSIVGGIIHPRQMPSPSSTLKALELFFRKTFDRFFLIYFIEKLEV